ncbi:MAG: c-type cytochrome, partial [Verrucomicrobiales bacterium]
HETPPMTWRGVRASMEASSRAGFRFLMRQPEPGEVEAIQTYLRSLTPLPGPLQTAEGGLTKAAARGKTLFESEETKCAHCHQAPLYTDLKTHDVGTRGPLDQAGGFDTPSLVEIYRTAPYLHDGSAPSLEDVVGRNAEDEHGRSSHLTKGEKDDLVAYLLSL